MTNYQRLQQLAQALAAANADVSEVFARELGRAARREKAGGGGFGIALRIGSAGQLEMRGGDLEEYVEGKPPGDGYSERIIPLDGMTG